MNTPICDFVNRYIQSDTLRAHMPGHKGQVLLGAEPWDITEIAGADSLYEAGGIIRESEQNAGVLFGSETFYSTEGSSQCIRAMLQLAALWARGQGKRPRIAAGRNAHKVFMSAAALLDMDVTWLLGSEDDSYLSCLVSAADLEAAFAEDEPPTAVYLTSPDYLGNMADLRTAAQVCHRHGALLLCDNAHGAYLKFLPQSQHPIDTGADICCDSAHKTLPVLTGGAYLHVSHHAPAPIAGWARGALALFGSTSPSYLVLQSLDRVNPYLAGEYPQKLVAFTAALSAMKTRLEKEGYVFVGEEPMKLTVNAKAYGYTGTALADALRERGVECEFADPDFLVLMLTPEMGDDLQKIEQALLTIPRRAAIIEPPPLFQKARQVMSPRAAMLSPWESLPIERCRGRVLASASVGCPPAVPIAVCGEQIDDAVMERFRYYGINECAVVREDIQKSR